MNNPPYRVAIAGCHRMLERKLAGHNWAAGFAAVPRTEIIAVFDRGADTRRAFVACWGPLPAYDDFDGLLAEVRPDILCVTTRQTLHADEIKRAAAAGVRGILCEKPLATSMGEVDRIVAACERHHVAFAFGLDRRWYPSYRWLTRALRDGLIGDVQLIVAFGMPNLINHGCHWFDRVLDLAGDPEVAWVSGQVAPLTGLPSDARQRLDPPGSCQIQCANGVEAFVSSGGSGFELEVVGTNGRLALVNDAAAAYLWRDKDSTPRPVEGMPLAPGPPAWPLAVEDLIDAVERGGQTVCDVHCARRATEIGFATHQSHHEGGRRIVPTEIDRALRIESFPWGNE